MARYNNKKKNFNEEIFRNKNQKYQRVPVTPSSFNPPQEGSYGDTRTVFQRHRSYDLEVQKIDINVVGHAPIHGKFNPTELYKPQWHSNALYTGALNNLYFNDRFRLLATIKREFGINYQGIDFSYLSTEPTIEQQKANPTEAQKIIDQLNSKLAIQAWKQNTTRIMSILKQAQYQDLDFFNIEYSPANQQLTFIPEIMGAPEFALLAYQTEMYTYLNTIMNFEALVSQLPKLQELYKGKADFFLHIQHELKRSNYTSIISQLLDTLKKRWIDRKFFKEIVAPLTSISKQTDGLNSPLVFGTMVYAIPMEPLALDGQAQPAAYHLYNRFYQPRTLRNNQKWITGFEHWDQNDPFYSNWEYQHDDFNGLFSRACDAFQVDTIVRMTLTSNDMTGFLTQFDRWSQTALKLLREMKFALIDFIRDPITIAIESALTKIATTPGVQGMNWHQNTTTNPMKPVHEYTNWELVNELVLFAPSLPIQNNNGFEISVPMFRLTGIPKQLQLEHFQMYYMPSNHDYISFVRLHERIELMNRENQVIQLIVHRTNAESFYEFNGFVWANDANNLSLVFQDKFPALQFTHGGDTLRWVNPNLMAYLPISVQNKSGDFWTYLLQSFITVEA